MALVIEQSAKRKHRIAAVRGVHVPQLDQGRDGGRPDDDGARDGTDRSQILRAHAPSLFGVVPQALPLGDPHEAKGRQNEIRVFL